MSSQILLQLNTGYKVPATGFGTWKASPGEVKGAVYEALKVGYRHLDLAKVYHNQPEVGAAIREAMRDFNIKREEIFITSKLWCNSHRAEHVLPALKDTLEELGLDYLDLYLIHWPHAFQAGPTLAPIGPDGRVILDKGVSLLETWKAMTELPKNLVRSVGVSNFSIRHGAPLMPQIVRASPKLTHSAQLKAIIRYTGVVPAMNQIERHPRIVNWPLIDYCEDLGILVTAYSSLGNNLFNIPILVHHEQIIALTAEFSKRYGKEVTPAQFLCAWGRYSHNTHKSAHCVIPKSVKLERVRENFVEFELDREAYEKTNKVFENDQRRYNIPYNETPQVNSCVFDEESDKNGLPIVLELL